MRPSLVVCTILAGAAVRILASHLSLFSREEPEETDEEIDPTNGEQTEESMSTIEQTTIGGFPTMRMDSNVESTLTGNIPVPQESAITRMSNRFFVPTTRTPTTTAVGSSFSPVIPGSTVSKLVFRLHPQVLVLLNKVAPIIRSAEYHPQICQAGDCTICLQSVTSCPKPLRITECGHVFHSKCLEEWVAHTAMSCLEWRNYVVCGNGQVNVTAQRPTCPNCVSRLRVLPYQLIQSTIFTALSNVSLSDASLAIYLIESNQMQKVINLMHSSIHFPSI